MHYMLVVEVRLAHVLRMITKGTGRIIGGIIELMDVVLHKK